MNMAKDYNAFTEEMEALIAKYGKLQHYETQYYDNRMDVSFAFRPHDPYFDDVDLDAEDESFEDFKRRMVGDEAVAGDVGYIEALEEFYQEYLDDYTGSNPESFEEFQERTLREDYADESFNADFGPVDEESQLAKALAAVREKSKRYAPTPLRLTKLPHPDQKTLKDFEADEWKLLPRDALGRWQKPVDSESIYQLRETLSSDVPDISDLLTMYGGDTPSNRFRLYRDLQQLSLDQMDAALPDDSQVSFDEADMTWMTPEEYFQYILEEEINVPEGENEESSLEFQDRLVRYTAATMSPTEIQELIADNMEEITKDLFVDREEAEGEIQYLKAVLRYQNFASKWQAETTQFKCDLCGIILSGSNRHVAGVGHYIDNYNSKGGYCCDQCNFTVVLPARTRGEHL